jgi:hypothetical protein
MTRREISAQKMIEPLVSAVFNNDDAAVIDGSYFDQISSSADQDTTDVTSPEGLSGGLCREGTWELRYFGFDEPASTPFTYEHSRLRQ